MAIFRVEGDIAGWKMGRAGWVDKGTDMILLPIVKGWGARM